MRGLLWGIDHSRLRLLYACSTLLDWEDSPGWGEGKVHQVDDVRAVCHGMTMFYPIGAEQFLEAVLNIPEKLRSLTQKVVGDVNA
jgi:hypothetical protein